jgi:predicted RNase H-like HicB family nuclease
MKTLTFPKTLEDYLNLNYSITFYPEIEGGYTVVMQDLPGCISTGETLQEAMDNILDAKQQWLETAIQYNDPIPLPSTLIDH